MSKFVLSKTKKIILTVILFVGPQGSFASSLSLEQALEATLKNNPTILRLIADYKNILSGVRLNKGVYDWSVNFDASYADQDQAQTVIFTPTNIKQTNYALEVGKSFITGTTFGLNSSIIRTEDNSTFNLFNRRYDTELAFSLQQSLLDGFIGLPDYVTVKTDKMRIQSIQLSLFRELEVLLSNTANLYWSLWRDVQLHLVAQESEKEAKEFLDETKRLSRLGLREGDEILQAEASWLQRQEEAWTAMTAMENSWMNLKSEMGTLEIETKEEIPELSKPTWKALKNESLWVKEAYQKRSDFKSAKLNREIQTKLRKSASGRLWPKLSISGGYSLTGLDPELNKSIDQIERSKIPGWNVGMSLSHSFGQNIDRSELENAEAELARAKSVYERISLNVNRDIRNGIRNFKRNEAILGLSQKIEKKRAQIQSAFRRKFKQGRIPIQDLLRSQENLRQAKYRRQISESNMAIAQMNLQLAKGTFIAFLDIPTLEPETFLRGAER